jgi:phosphohistidine phosphatase
MALYLVQHGLAHPESVDPERGLTNEGIAEVERIASVAAGYKVHVSAIRHSGKKRARQTAEIMSRYLLPYGPVEETHGLNPNDDVRAFARLIDPGLNEMIVGHLPFLEKLVSYLITGNSDTRIFRFQNGGIVCMDMFDAAKTWTIKWTLMPNIG